MKNCPSCLIQIVHDCVPGVNLAHSTDESAVEKHPFCRRCFSRVNVRHDANVADFPVQRERGGGGMVEELMA
jgi:hypothetical protein